MIRTPLPPRGVTTFAPAVASTAMLLLAACGLGVRDLPVDAKGKADVATNTGLDARNKPGSGADSNASRATPPLVATTGTPPGEPVPTATATAIATATATPPVTNGTVPPPSGGTGSSDSLAAWKGLVAVGDWHVCYVDPAYAPVCFGKDGARAVAPVGRAFERIASGHTASCGLLREPGVAKPREVSCWGNVGGGRAAGATSAHPEGFSDIAMGDLGGCAIEAKDGSLKCWGDHLTTQFPPPAGVRFRQIDADGLVVCGVALDDTVHCWGSDVDNQTMPVPTLLGTGKRVSVADYHVCVQRLDDTAQCYGSNAYRQITLPEGLRVTQIEAGANRGGRGDVRQFGFTCWIAKADSKVECVGEKAFTRPDDKLMVAPTDFKARFIDAQGNLVCAVPLEGTTLSCFGAASFYNVPTAPLLIRSP